MTLEEYLLEEYIQAFAAGFYASRQKWNGDTAYLDIDIDQQLRAAAIQAYDMKTQDDDRHKD